MDTTPDTPTPVSTNPSHDLPDTPEVRAALSDPATFLRNLTRTKPGWSAPYGGPEGVVQLAARIRRDLDVQVRIANELRSVAVAELLRSESLSQVGDRLGIGKTAVHKIHREVSPKAFLYQHLLVDENW